MFGAKYKLGLIASGMIGSKQEFRISYLNNLKKEKDFIESEIQKIDDLVFSELKKQGEKCFEMQNNINENKSFVDEKYKKDFIKEVEFLEKMNKEFNEQKEINETPLFERLNEIEEGIEYLNTAIKITNQTREISPSMHTWFK